LHCKINDWKYEQRTTEMRSRTQIKILFEELFYQEIASSKRLRAGILISLLGFQGVALFLIYMLNSKEYFQLFNSSIALYAVLIFMGLIMVYETLAWYLSGKDNKSGVHGNRYSGYMAVFIEISLLSLLLVFIIRYSNQVIILQSPAALTYFVFIILSTLRLDFKLSVFTGMLAAFQYVLISGFFNQNPLPEHDSFILTKIQYLGQGITMVTAGVAAGFAADVIKKNMRSSFDNMYEKKMVIDLFGQQISQKIAGEILKNPVELSGKRKDVCIMFLDIRDFSHYVEYKDPEDVVSYLNYLFSYMIEAVEANHGIINQFLGDGFMATFGAPVPDQSSCEHAVAASKEIIKRTREESDKGNIPKTRLGIGLHFGEAVTGNIGSSVRKQYSITGNVVIIASRIEQLNKKFNSQLMISEEVYNELAHVHKKSFFPIGRVNIKGSEKPVMLHKWED
jgi:adenylate cyclase